MRLRNAFLAVALLACAIAIFGSTPARADLATTTPAAMSAASSAAPAAVPALLGLAAAEQQPAKDINVNIKTSGGGGWYKNPVIIGIGVLLLVLIIVLATRGGGTTVVKD